jgi:NADPH:quinone reductase-like Zn-dependent oxidoreductase
MKLLHLLTGLSFLNNTNMKAIILNEFGPASNLHVADVPVPQINNEEVLVKVNAISINPVDISTRNGKGLATAIKERPIILGWDISGEVTESKSSLFKKGDEVFGMVNFPGHGKAYAEYVAAPAGHITLKPANISHNEAAAACMAAVTAWQNLTEHFQVKKNQRVLIHGGSGGVGHYAIQIAKHLGAYVITTSSEKNKKFVLSLGADEHIDYKTVHFEDVVSGIDFVLNTQNSDIAERSLSVMKKGGTIINIASSTTDAIKEKSELKGIKVLHTSVISNDRDIQQLADLLENKKIKSHVQDVFALEDIQKAHSSLETGRTVGKIIIKPA